VGVNEPLRFSIKSSRLLERVGERDDDEGPSPREEQPSMRGEMPEGMDRSSWMSEAECVRGRPSMTPPAEGKGECCSSVEPGPVKKQNLQTRKNKLGNRIFEKEGPTYLFKNCL
jgi:hypothetical protein